MEFRQLTNYDALTLCIQSFRVVYININLALSSYLDRSSDESDTPLLMTPLCTTIPSRLPKLNLTYILDHCMSFPQTRMYHWIIFPGHK